VLEQPMREAKASILLRQRDYRASLVERGGEFVDLRMSYDTGTDPSALPPPSVLVGYRRYGKLWRMRQRNLRVVKWIGTIPVIGVCTVCDRSFTVPLPAIKRVADAQGKSQGPIHGA
jgi:hypothetical protein